MSDNLESRDYTEQLGEALQEVNPEPVQEPEDDIIRLSTGVVLTPKKVSPFLFQEVSNKFKYPPVPKVFDENKDREIENPMHPAYLAACEEVDLNRSMAMIDGTIALGTTLVSIPEGFPTPDDEDWLDDLEGIEIVIDRNNKRLRYRTWIKYIAAPSVSDVQQILTKVLRTIGVKEDAVAEAIANFQHSS